MRIFISFLFLLNLIKANELIITYPNLKKSYYKNQIVNLKVNIVMSEDENLSFFLNKGDLNFTKKPYIYHLNLKFKNDLNNTLKIIGKDVNKTINLNSLFKTIPIEKIPHFCNVLAENLKILNPISTLTNNRILLFFTINTTNGNLEDFKLSYPDENLTLLNENTANYYVYLPKYVKKFSFYYFNTIDETYKKVTIPIILKEETISTQTSINPEKEIIFEPIYILIMVIIAFFLIIFLVYQNILILIIPLLLSVYLAWSLLLPKEVRILKANSKVKILPTINSTIFFIPKKDVKVKVLKKIKNYSKIEVNKKIGWVKNEDLK